MFIVFSAALFMNSYTPGSAFKSSFFEVSRFTLILFYHKTNSLSTVRMTKECFLVIRFFPTFLLYSF